MIGKTSAHKKKRAKLVSVFHEFFWRSCSLTISDGLLLVRVSVFRSSSIKPKTREKKLIPRIHTSEETTHSSPIGRRFPPSSVPRFGPVARSVADDQSRQWDSVLPPGILCWK